MQQDSSESATNNEPSCREGHKLQDSERLITNEHKQPEERVKHIEIEKAIAKAGVPEEPRAEKAIAKTGAQEPRAEKAIAKPGVPEEPRAEKAIAKPGAQEPRAEKAIATLARSSRRAKS